MNTTVAVIGGANVERVLIPRMGPFVTGRKTEVEAVPTVGGGGVNASARLLSAGVDVFPILAIGRDEGGRRIQSLLSDCGRRGGVSAESVGFIESEDFYSADYVTPTTTIICDRGIHRSSQLKECGDADRALAVLSNRLRRMPTTKVQGFLQFNLPVGDGMAEIAKIIAAVLPPHAVLFENPGLRELADRLGDGDDECVRVDVLQLGYRELSMLLGEVRDERGALAKLLSRYSNPRLRLLVTFGAYGALGIDRASHLAIHVPPLARAAGFVDPTGAGDAFAAGFMKATLQSSSDGSEAFLTALREGRLWAAHACASFGGATNAPDTATLEALREKGSGEAPDTLRRPQGVLDETDEILRHAARISEVT